MRHVILVLFAMFTAAFTAFDGMPRPVEDGLAAYSQGDYSTALRLWKPLADQGNVNLANNIGVLYRDGLGVPIDNEEAARWFRKAAIKGYPHAQNNLAAMYLTGKGVEKSPEEAVKWLRQAATKGLNIAQYNLGRMYVSGRGVATSNVKALMWFESASCITCGTMKARDKLLTEMTPAQISEARSLLDQCRARNYDGCE
jgi:hypothetical protein